MKGFVISLLAVAAVSSASADLLIDPTGGTVLFDSTENHDDQIVFRNFGFNFPTSTGNITGLNVSINGNLNSNGDWSYYNEALSRTTGTFIAPLWDDHYIFKGSGESIVETKTADYYAVTWDVAHYGNALARQTFQAVLFGASTTLKGVTYSAGDVVFAYGMLTPNASDTSATVGTSFGTDPTPVPGSASGIISTSNPSLISDNLGDYIVYNQDGHTYRAGVVPEPSAFLALGFPMLALAFRRKRK